MPFNGLGVFTPLITFVPNTPATAEDQNSQDTDFADGLSDCMTRDGQAPATGNQNFGGFRLNNMATGAASSDAATVGQIGTMLSALVPAGFCMPFAGGAAPSGWLVCDGSSITAVSQPALFAAIGYTYGGSGANFNLPNADGKVIAGLDTAGTTLAFATAVGVIGGEQSHVLTTPELAAHSHPFSATTGNNLSGHTHTTSGTIQSGSSLALLASGSALTTTTTTSSGESAPHQHNVSGTTSNAGGGGAHNNVQPTLVLLWCIKT